MKKLDIIFDQLEKILELYKVPTSISDQDLAENIVQVLSLIGFSVNQNDIVQCHRLKKKTNVIVKLKER